MLSWLRKKNCGKRTVQKEAKGKATINQGSSKNVNNNQCNCVNDEKTCRKGASIIIGSKQANNKNGLLE